MGKCGPRKMERGMRDIVKLKAILMSSHVDEGPQLGGGDCYLVDVRADVSHSEPSKIAAKVMEFLVSCEGKHSFIVVI
jgi:hypothetical protein